MTLTILNIVALVFVALTLGLNLARQALSNRQPADSLLPSAG